MNRITNFVLDQSGNVMMMCRKKALLGVIFILALMLGFAAAQSVPLSPEDAQSHFGLPPERARGIPMRPQRKKPSDLNSGAGSTNNSLTSTRLIYHGGPIMPTSTIYLIFWEPPSLQNGASAIVYPNFNNIMYQYVIDINGSALLQTQTQYGVQNKVSYGGFYLDTSAFPTNVCYNQVTGLNCIGDDWIRYMIKKAMYVKGWTGGANKIFMVYTGRGEGSCNGYNTNRTCALGWNSYLDYCGYHNYFAYQGQWVLYANMPYADSGNATFNCYGRMPAAPHDNVVIDAELSVTSHEHFETITDPFLNAWYDSAGEENGDKCAWYFNPYSSLGNQVLNVINGRRYILQDEFSNMAFDAGLNPCVQR